MNLFKRKKHKLAKSFKPAQIQPRTREEINQEYNNACAFLGDRYFRMSALQSEVSGLLQKLGAINEEASAVPLLPPVPQPSTLSEPLTEVKS